MLLNHTLRYLPAQILGPFSQFIAVIVWTYLLEPSVFGVVAYIIAAQELSFSFGISWWSMFTLRYRRRFEEEPARGAYRGTDNAVILFSVLVQLAGSLLIVRLATGSLSPQLVTIVSLYIISRSTLGHFGEWARSQEQILTYTLAALCGPLLGSIASVLAIMQFGSTVEVVLGAFVLVQIATLIVVMMRLGMKLSLRKFDFLLVKNALSYGLPLAVAGIFGWATLNGIRVVVQQVADLAAVGLLSVGWGIGHRITAVAAMAVTAAAYPLAVKAAEEGDADQGLEQISVNAILLFGLMAPVSAGMFLVSTQMVTLAVADEFTAATIIILPLAVLVGSVKNLRTHWADGAHLLMAKTTQMTVINFIEAVVSMIGCYLGYKMGDLMGACLGVLVGVLIGAVLSFAHAIVVLKMPILWGGVFKIAFATAAMALGVSLMPDDVSWLGLISCIAVGGLVYVAMLYALFDEVRSVVRDEILPRLTR